MIIVDMGLAREVHRNRIRSVRKSILGSLDVEVMRAIETSSDIAPIAARKQVLRDATSADVVDKAKTPEELIETIPDEGLKASYNNLPQLRGFA